MAGGPYVNFPYIGCPIHAVLMRLHEWGTRLRSEVAGGGTEQRQREFLSVESDSLAELSGVVHAAVRDYLRDLA